MGTVMPEGENVRKAVKWVSECRREFPERRLTGLIGEAAVKFDLSPKDTLLVEDFFLRENT